MAAPVLRFLEREVAVYRRTWRGSFFSSFLTPVLFLGAMGIGLGSLVDQGPSADALGDVDYLAFVGPGLLAASMMQTASFASTWPVLGAVHWQKQWHAAAATPMEPREIADGFLLFTYLRMLLNATVFVVVLVAFGVPEQPTTVLAAVAAPLVGMAFAAPIAAWTATQKNESGFNVLFRFVITPLFLFSGAFFPVSQLPGALELVAWLVPVWHGVELCRELVVRGIDASSPLHVAYLGVWIVVGRHWYQRTLRGRLVS